MITIKKTQDFDDWFVELNTKEQSQVLARLDRIKAYEHFGDAKNLGNGLCELRWKNGWRVYFIAGKTDTIILLMGGHKNEQEKNIKKARLHISRYTSH